MGDTSSLRVKQFLNNPNASIYFYRVLRFIAQSGRYYRDLKTESFEV